jgi:hypothetical protein
LKNYEKFFYARIFFYIVFVGNVLPMGRLGEEKDGSMECGRCSFAIDTQNFVQNGRLLADHILNRHGQDFKFPVVKYNQKDHEGVMTCEYGFCSLQVTAPMSLEDRLKHRYMLHYVFYHHDQFLKRSIKLSDISDFILQNPDLIKKSFSSSAQAKEGDFNEQDLQAWIDSCKSTNAQQP